MTFHIKINGIPQFKNAKIGNVGIGDYPKLPMRASSCVKKE
jgi:hypothetical protein